MHLPILFRSSCRQCAHSSLPFLPATYSLTLVTSGTPLLVNRTQFRRLAIPQCPLLVTTMPPFGWPISLSVRSRCTIFFVMTVDFPISRMSMIIFCIMWTAVPFFVSCFIPRRLSTARLTPISFLSSTQPCTRRECGRNWTFPTSHSMFRTRSIASSVSSGRCSIARGLLSPLNIMSASLTLARRGRLRLRKFYMVRMRP